MSGQIVDGRRLAPNTQLSCDICIVGAGPIGLSTALEFAGTKHDVIILESGGMNVGDEQNDLSRLAQGAQHGPNDHITANRRFGGNSNVWIQVLSGGRLGVRFGEFQPVDFAMRPGVPHSGWPITYDDLAPFTRRVAERWELDPEGFGAEAYAENYDHEFTGFSPFETSVYQFPDAALPRNKFRKQLEQASNIRIIHHSTAAKVKGGCEGNLAQIDIRTRRSHAFTVDAKRVVLAGGAMASTQLLLHSPTPAGHTLGNSNDVVGRYLMDHPLLQGGDLILNDPSAARAFSLYDNRARGEHQSQGYFHPTDEFMREQNELPNLNMFIFPRCEGYVQASKVPHRERVIHDAAVHTKLALQRQHLPPMKDVLTALSGPDIVVRKLFGRFFSPHYNLGRGGWSSDERLLQKCDRFEIIQYAEQFPHQDNRLYLSDEEDELGMKRVNFDFKLHDSDQRAMKLMQRQMQSMVAESGLGRLELPFEDEDDKVDVIAPVIGHYIGTTRMGTDPKTSVVDADCRIHGTESVYIASTSTFATGGTSNPTLTGLALALRIADTIKGEL